MPPPAPFATPGVTAGGCTGISADSIGIRLTTPPKAPEGIATSVGTAALVVPPRLSVLLSELAMPGRGADVEVDGLLEVSAGLEVEELLDVSTTVEEAGRLVEFREIGAPTMGTDEEFAKRGGASRDEVAGSEVTGWLCAGSVGCGAMDVLLPSPAPGCETTGWLPTASVGTGNVVMASLPLVMTADSPPRPLSIAPWPWSGQTMTVTVACCALLNCQRVKYSRHPSPHNLLVNARCRCGHRDSHDSRGIHATADCAPTSNSYRLPNSFSNSDGAPSDVVDNANDALREIFP